MPPGTSIVDGRYRLLGRLGRAASGTVWRVEDLCTRAARGAPGPALALKALFPTDGDERLVSALRGGFGPLAPLADPDLATVRDFGRLPAGELPKTDRAGYYFTRDLIEGEDLSRAVAACGPREAVRLLGRTALALDTLHRAGVVHGHLKPGNVIVGPDGRPRLVDFGLGRGEVGDRQADLHALGLMVFELLAERQPALASLDTVLDRLLARDPDAKYASAAEAAAALLGLLGEPMPERAPLRPVFRSEAYARAAAQVESMIRARILERAPGPALCLVVGEPGAGKATLLRETRWRAQLVGIEAFAGQTGGSSPLGPVPAMLDQVAALAGTGSGPGSAASNEGARWRRAEEISRALSVAARRAPILWTLDVRDPVPVDLPPLLRYLSHALEAEAVLIVAGATPDVAAALADVPTLALGPLRVEEVSAALELACPKARPRLAERVVRRTGGILELVAEAVRAAAASDADPALPQTPESLVESIRARLAALDSPARSVAEALAVIGRAAAPALLSSAMEGTVVDESLAALARVGLLSRDIDGPSLRPVAAAVLMGAMSPARRTELHLRVARALRAEAGSPAELVRHLAAAGQRVPALSLLGAALDELVASGALGAALEIGESLLASLPSSRPQTRGLRLRLAEIARSAGDLTRTEALVRPLASARVAERGRALVLLGRARAEAGQTIEAEAALRRALDEDREARAAAARELGVLMVRLGRAGEAEKLLVEAIPGAPATLRAGLRCALALARGTLGEVAAAERQVRGVLQEARARADRPTELFALSTAALLRDRQGDGRQAAERWQDALGIARELGDVERAASLGLHLAACQIRLGDYARLLPTLTEAVRALRAVGADLALAQACVSLGHTFLTLGLLEQASAELHAASTQAARLKQPRQEGLALLHQGICDARRGDVPRGRRRLAQAEQRLEATGDPMLLAELRLDRAELEISAGDTEAARAALHAAERTLSGERPREFEARRVALAARVAAPGLSDWAEARAQILASLGALNGGSRPLEAELHMAAWELAAASADPASSSEHALAATRLHDSMTADLPAAVQRAYWQDPRRAAIRSAAVGATPAAGTAVSATVVEERLLRVVELNRRLNSDPDPTRVIEHVMDAAVELVRAERGLLLLERDQELRVEILRNVDRETLEAEGFSRSLAERSFSSGEPVVTGPPSDPGRREERSPARKAIACIPVLSAGRMRGVMYLETRLESGRFGPEEMRLLQAFGDQVGIALHSARLVHENAESARELERARRDHERLAEEGRERRNGEPLRVETAPAEPRAQLSIREGRFGMVGRSAAMQRVFERIERVAAFDLPVLIEGESGTGKEMVARAIHDRSQRRDGPMVSLNCAAVPESLLESELYGHVRGAFTGAERDREGLFVAASRGTLFLDEIGDMSARMQVDLLRVLQEKRVRPVGGVHDVEADARVVAASQTPLADLVKQGRFREDLYYRLNVVTVPLPPLRERPEDVAPLVEHLLEVIAVRSGTAKKTVTRGALRRLGEQTWPGNVRQLEHVLTHAHVLCDGEAIDEDDLALDAATEPAAQVTRAAPLSAAQREAQERRRILEALEAAGWNRSRACKQLGMPRRTFYRRLRAYGVL